MTRRGRTLFASVLAVVAALAVAGAASAHPLGNYTVNRAVVVRIWPTRVEVRYVVDMAEIPTFTERQGIDRDGNGQIESVEAASYVADACATDRAALRLTESSALLPLSEAANPQLSFPEGAGGLPTLRLVCVFVAALPAWPSRQQLEMSDMTDDGHVGWREVTITGGDGIEIDASDVPSVSRSAELTRYPAASLQSPPDVRAGRVTFHRTSAGASGQGNDHPGAPTNRVTADDPLASLVGGHVTPPLAIIALLLAAGLGAAHAVSPGHGKTLVTAYLIGSGGSLRHAATLGLTVAITHTAGVFLLGLGTLAAGQFLVPEQVIGWLSIASGILVVGLGGGLVVRALRRTAHRVHDHDYRHPHPHDHPHPHQPTLRPRNVVALGLAGGMVPSGSALIVLLVAITTDRLLFGVLLIVAFGLGMALVLGGLAVATTLARAAFTRPARLTSAPLVRSLVRALPLVSGMAVLGAGVVVTLEAIARFA